MTFKRPTVLHIITGLNDGGAEAVMFNLIKDATGFEHKVISLMGEGKYGPLIKRHGFEVSCLGLNPSLPSPLALIRLAGMVRRAQPDVVQTWMYHADLLGGLAAWLAGVRSIVWGIHHTTLSTKSIKRTTRWVVRLNAMLSQWLPTSIITCSTNGVTVHRNIGYPANKLVVVHNGYNTDSFKPDNAARAAIRAEFAVDEGCLLLGCVARFNPQKDHRNLILAFADVALARPDARLMLIGPGLTADNCEVTALLRELDLVNRVILVGARPDIPAVMNGLDLHVLSSNSEAFPNVLSEAMSCGTPCVATDVGDSAVIVGGTGRVVAPSDPKALAEAILDIAPSVSEPEVRGGCRDRILQNFTLAHMTYGYERVWRHSMAAED